MTRPAQARALDHDFVSNCCISALQKHLPLCWPRPAETPPSPKLSYRSSYQYLGWEELADPTAWGACDDFEVLLQLVDFSGLRDVLAERLAWCSAQGQVPFDPISLFLLTAGQISHGWSRAATLRNLHQERYADYARLFGFRKGVFPTEGGLRHFLTALGKNSHIPAARVAVEQGEQVIEVGIQQLNQLVAQSVALIRASGVLSEASWQKGLLCPDGQIHTAASRLRCHTCPGGRAVPGKRECLLLSAHTAFLPSQKERFARLRW